MARKTYGTDSNDNKFDGKRISGFPVPSQCARDTLEGPCLTQRMEREQWLSEQCRTLWRNSGTCLGENRPTWHNSGSTARQAIAFPSFPHPEPLHLRYLDMSGTNLFAAAHFVASNNTFNEARHISLRQRQTFVSEIQYKSHILPITFGQAKLPGRFWARVNKVNYGVNYNFSPSHVYDHMHFFAITAFQIL